MNDQHACPSLATLELLARAEPVDPAVTGHLESCAACRDLFAEISANEAFVGAYPALRDSSTAGGARAAHLQDALDLPAGLVPGYRLLRELHRGGQGVVYLAMQERTRREVAIKMLLAGAFATDKQRARFELEAELAARLRHPAIVTVHDTVPLARSRYAIVMEYVGGVPLDQWSPPGDTARERRDSWLRLFVAICDAVQYAHHRQVAHRDLKPRNILVSAEGQPKILDFGIAKAVGGDALETLTEGFVGTLAYASPEQLTRNAERVDTRTDVYSLGVMLYECLTGRRPFATEGSLEEILRRMSDREPAPPGRAGGPFPLDGDADAVLLRALRFDPAERYQTAGGLGRDLENLLNGSELTIRRDNTMYVLRKRLRRHRSGIALACVLLAVAVGAVVMIVRARAGQLREAEEHARAEDESRRAEAVAYVMGGLIGNQNENSASGRELLARLLGLQGRLEAGSLYDSPRLEVEVQRTLSLLNRQCAPENGWPAELASRRGVLLSQQLDGPRSVQVARAYVDLGRTLLARKRYEEAAEVGRESLRVLSHLGTRQREPEGGAYDVLARALIELGDLAGAEEACDRAQTAWADPSGGALELRGLDTRIELLLARKDWGGAMSSCEEALRLRFLSREDDAPEIVAGLAQAARILSGAPAGTVEDTPIVRALGSSGSNQTAESLRSIAGTVQGPSADRAEALLRLREIKRALFGDDHFETAETASLIGQSFYAAKRADLALPFISGFVGAVERKFGDGTLPLASAYELMSANESRAGDPAASARWLEKASKIWASQPPGPNTEFIAALGERDTGRAFMAAGLPEDAARYLRSAVERHERLGAGRQLAAALCLTYLAKAELACGRLDGAADAAQRACDVERTNRSMTSGQRAEVWLAMGMVLDRQGRRDEADRYFNDALRGWERPIPEDSAELPDYQIVFEALARHARDREDWTAMEEWNRRLPEAKRVVPARPIAAPAAPSS